MTKSQRDKLRPGYKACRARYQQKHKERFRRKVLQNFGLTPEDYDLMLEAQNGLCAICDKPPTLRRHAVDHDHQTTAVRGLLCRACNVGLGLFKDNPALLMSAISYLKSYGK